MSAPGTSDANPVPQGNQSGEHRYHFAIDIDGEFAVFTLDTHGQVETWNASAERITGYGAGEILGKPLSVLYPTVSAGVPVHSDILVRAATTGRAYDEGWHARKDGIRFWASVLVIAQQREQGDLAGFAAVTHDLSQRQLIEAKLRRSEQRLQAMIDSVEDYAIFMLSPTGEVTSWNTGAQRIEGYCAGEIIGRHFSVFYPPEARTAGLPERMLETASTQGRSEAEGWRVRSDGSRFWADAIITPIRDDKGALQGFAKVTRDLTEHKRLEQLEHVGELAAATERAREEEKKRIARELHDDLGQQLTALKMSAVILQQDVEAGHYTAETAAKARGLVVQADDTMSALRRIASNLRPTMLDDLGLLPAVEWLADEFSRRYGIKASTRLSAGELAFSDTASTAIFRIVQEALTNVARHACATEVVVTIELDDNACEVRIDDNGRGAASAPGDKPDSFGLLGIRERVRQLNGTVSLGNRLDRGFRVQIRFPIDTIVRH
ncbi:PAS/PAC sensor signal transduction histidine kinase [Paraburkholderia phymatum STM815]|uniref:PAS/PAC sensor signal transduction histidine kinase n=1 Tax=Paraburkholderia phymatum (strain DSM 17167 / CIP 108236 / LMG 21445 / STM815) TaxID=391038 RepID=B2JH43_PARP8|nr:PAS/PAC sensor signal transduction histidine kinase [Paraburkholderia phymatum STM815]